MKQYLCIHGHFYQPPRENPWSGRIDPQPSAHPYHDWNARVTAECYTPNCQARILDAAGHIRREVNNYETISFNFGPTLLAWLQEHIPQTYAAVLDADRRAMARFGGHGSALAQAYNHVILPLADRYDKQVQVAWGLADFRHRFGRDPEGMWLPETAVDIATLEVLAEAGVTFTILAPHQARRVRRLQRGRWCQVSATSLDTRHPYLCRLPSGRSIVLFFYDGQVAQEVAFSDLLRDGEMFARRLLGRFDAGESPQLVHIATDGETYGHHHRFGDMALAYVLDAVQQRRDVALTVYGEYLALYPPEWEVSIVEGTSWSCAHGIERWRSDCGCRIDGTVRSQAWRRPLRDALDALREVTRELYRQRMAVLGVEPFRALLDYIEILLDDRPETREAWLSRHTLRRLSTSEQRLLFELLELGHFAQLMYTSCGWYFDDVAGLEATQVIAYAARVAQLAGHLSGHNYEEAFVARLAQVRSNDPAIGTGAELYRRVILPLRG